MAVVVRCGGCGGAARVRPEAVGLLVICPRCGEPFLATDESAARPRRSRAPAPAPRPRAEPITPPDDPAPDPHADQPAGELPVSVMIGLALLPFAVPLVWLIAPLVFGHRPTMSFATPASLAASAAVLCLAVVFTIDWSPATRLKGVVLLVGLAYFTGVCLFFMKKDFVDQAMAHFGPTKGWHVFRPPGGGYEVKFPGAPKDSPDQRLPTRVLTYHAGKREPPADPVAFVAGWGRDARAADAAERWFDDAADELLRATGGQLAPVARPVPDLDEYAGREWVVRLPGPAGAAPTRVVRLYRGGGRVYYLSAEGPHLDPGDDAVRVFFESFAIDP